MRIAFLTTEFSDLGRGRGGLGYYLARSVPLLVARGHECEVFLASGGGGEAEDDGVLERHGVLIRKLGTRTTPFDELDLPAQVMRHLRSAWVMAGHLEEVGRRSPFDVVQVPNFGASGIFVDGPVPVVMRFSSHAPTWHRAAGEARTRRIIFGEMLQRWAIGNADGHFAPSRFVAGLVQADLGLDVEVCRPPIPATIDRAQWDVEWVRAVAGTRSYVLHAGQLGRAKGTDLVVNAAPAFLQENPGLHLHLCGRDAGAGPAIAALRDRIPGRVHDHGRVPPERLHPLMERARAVISPSRADNLPNVVIEAMSLGVPVIGVRGASIDELVVHGESGYLVPVGDTAALAAAVGRLVRLAQPEQRRMGASARARALTLLDAEETIGELTELYDRTRRSGARARPPRDRVATYLKTRLRASGHLLRARAALASRWRRLTSRVR